MKQFISIIFLFISAFGVFSQQPVFEWASQCGNPPNTTDTKTVLASGPDGQFYLAGEFLDTTQFGGKMLISEGSTDIFLAKFSVNGDLLWATSAGGSSSDQCRSASCDPEGNILLSGSFYYDISFGDTILSTLDPVGVFVARYLPDGQLDRAFQLEGTYLSTENYMVSGQEGDFYISGNFSEMIQFDDNSFYAGEFNQDIFIAKYDASFDLLWARHAFSIASDQVIGVNIDQDDNAYITGHYLDTIQFEQLTLPYTLCCGSREIFIVKYNDMGDLLWGQQISGARASIQSMTLNSEDELLLSGLFTEEVTLGNFKLSNFDGFHNYVSSLQTSVFASTGHDLKVPGLKVYPNPAVNILHIINPGNTGHYNYLIYGRTGSLVLSGTIGTDDFINIDFLPSSQYLLRLVDSFDNSVRSCLFIKQ